MGAATAVFAGFLLPQPKPLNHEGHEGKIGAKGAKTGHRKFGCNCRFAEHVIENKQSLGAATAVFAGFLLPQPKPLNHEGHEGKIGAKGAKTGHRKFGCNCRIAEHVVENKQSLGAATAVFAGFAFPRLPPTGNRQ